MIRRLVLLGGVFVLAAATFAGPAAADPTYDGTSEDTFETTDAPLTLEIDSVVDISHDPGEDDDIWTPGTSVIQVTVDVADANTLAGLTLYVCLESDEPTFDCLTQTGVPSEWGGAFVIASPDAAPDTFAISEPVPGWTGESAAFASGGFSSSSATVVIDVAVAAIARKTTSDRWRVVVFGGTEGPGALVVDSTGDDYQVEGYVEAFSGVSDRALGAVATGAWGATVVSQSLTGIVANADWKISMEALDDEWARTGGGAPAELVTSGTPGTGEFALRCASGVDPDVSTGFYVADGSPVDITGASGAALTEIASPGSTDLRCRIRNGATAAGTYTGTVQTTLTLQ